MKEFIFFQIFLLNIHLILAQANISGNVVNENNQPLSGVNVIISPVASNQITAYAITDKDGNYKILYKPSGDQQLTITAKLLGFASSSVNLNSNSEIIDFQLSEELIELKDIIAKASPIRLRGDTVNYSVNSFAKEHDRSIGDVIARLPGIEIQSDGKILYQGKPINKYYIENLDMLEGRYNIANENLSYKDVASVQVLENHQPIKVLDSLVWSESAALNIKLKDSYTITGQAELGIGASPLLWDANITPMIFAKNKQILATYQTNNTGHDISNQFNTFGRSSSANPLRNDFTRHNWLNLQSMSIPNFTDKRWLDNNIHLVSINALHKLKSDYQLKFNISYLNDYQKLEGKSKTKFYTLNDTVQLFENQYNKIFKNVLSSNLIVEKNEKQNFFKNTLNVQANWDGARGLIHRNNDIIQQELENNYFKITNSLKSIFPIGNQMMNLNSYFGYNHTPQSLQIQPGQFISLLNQDEAYNSTLQELTHQQLFTTNTIGFDKKIQGFTFSPSIGFEWLKQTLNSTIFIDEDELMINEFNNEMDWTRQSSFAQLKTQYQKKNWRFSLTTPIVHTSYNIADEHNNRGLKFKRWVFIPNLLVNYEPSAFWKFSFGSSYSESYGTINQLHYAYIIKTYRNIQRISAPLAESKSHSYITSFTYKNPVRALFWNLDFTYINLTNNLLYASQIQSNGSTEVTAIERDNSRTAHRITSKISKYFGRISANLSLKGTYRESTSEQLLNDALTKIKSQSLGLTTIVEKDITDKMNIEIYSNWWFRRNTIQTSTQDWITRQSHQFKFNVYPNETQYFGVQTEWSINEILLSKKDYFFADLIYRYTWKKHNLDFELQWNNIFNTQEYSMLNIDAYSYAETNFRLRPSQALAKVRFSF